MSKKVVFISGASTGIGREIARKVVSRDRIILIHYNCSTVEAEQLANEISIQGYEIGLIQADLSKEGDCCYVQDEVQKYGYQVEILINNVGAAISRTPFLQSDDSLWINSFQLNLMSMVRLTRLFLPGMIQQNYGRIINISSVAARNGGDPNSLHYSSMKGAINTFTLGLAKQVAEYGITVNAVAPGIIDTPFQKKNPRTSLDNIHSLIPVGRLGKPEEVASLVAYLASEESSYINGEIITISGGRL